MKRIIFAFLLVFVVTLLISPSKSFASILYSNDFTSDYSGWTSIFGSCTTGANGLTCSNPGTGSLYHPTFPNVSCISADFTNPTLSDSNTYVGLTDNTSSGWFHDGMILAASSYVLPGYIGLYDGSWHDTGVPTFTGKHNLKFCYDGINSTGYLDGTLIGTHTSSHPTRIGFFISLSGTSVTNLIVTDTLPSPTPTSTPTPTATPIQLNVPLVKQTSNPWQGQEYDTAHLWAPLYQTIHDWGCALTSAVMVLQYNGIVKMPDNSLLDPGSLNAWLKTQPDGYVGNGLVNWLAISRFTRLVRLAFNNPNYLYDALVYRRPTVTVSQLTDDLSHNIPDILEEPGHFVVATGTQGNTFTINDPYFNRTVLTDTYNNAFLALGKFVPSHTDLSYIMLVGSTSLNFSITDATGSAVGNQYTQNPLENDTNPGNLSGQPLHMYYVEAPSDGTYAVTVNTSGQNQPYSVNEYLYDLNGNVTISSASGTTDNNAQATMPIVFNKVTFQSFLVDLQNTLDLKLLPKGVYNALVSQIKNIQKEIENGQISVAKLHLNVISMLLQVMPGISQQAKDLLQSDITALLQSI